MRPTSRPQSALRCPLNHILGTEANVRVLRAILLSDIPIGVPELARRAELQPSGRGKRPQASRGRLAFFLPMHLSS